MVIPVRSFRFGKQRLSGLVDPERRERLGRALAGRVATLVDRAGLTPLIVTADREVASWAGSAGHAVTTDPGEGLDTACQVGAAWAEDVQERWMVLHADLPLLVAGDLKALVEPIERGAGVAVTLQWISIVLSASRVGSISHAFLASAATAVP